MSIRVMERFGEPGKRQVPIPTLISSSVSLSPGHQWVRYQLSFVLSLEFVSSDLCFRFSAPHIPCFGSIVVVFVVPNVVECCVIIGVLADLLLILLLLLLLILLRPHI